MHTQCLLTDPEQVCSVLRSRMWIEHGRVRHASFPGRAPPVAKVTDSK